MFSSRYITAVLALAASTVTARAPTYHDWPSEAEIDLIFPLNETYRTPSSALPIVFGVTKDKYTDVLIDQLNYTLLDAANTSNILGKGQFSPGKGDGYPAVDSTTTVALDDQVYWYSYSSDIIGREGQFILNITLTHSFCRNNSEKPNHIDGPLKNWNATYAYFSTRNTTGLEPVLDTVSTTASSSVSGSRNTTCLPGASWALKLNVNGYRDDPSKKGDSCAVVGSDGLVPGPRACAVQLDDPTITSIAAVVMGSAAVESSQAAAAASKAAAKANAGVLAHGAPLGFGAFVAAWVVMVFSLSGWAFATMQ